MMGEHGNYNQANPYLTSAGVPFIIRYPGHIKKNQVVTTAYSSPDFTPTILSLMGVDHSDITFQGIDGSNEILNDNKWSRAPKQVRFISARDWSAAVQDQYKLVVARYETPWLFDLKRDPNEMINYSTNPKHKWIMNRLQQKLMHGIEMYKLTNRDVKIMYFDQPACHDSKDQIPYLPNRVCNHLKQKKHSGACKSKKVSKFCPNACGSCCKDSKGFLRLYKRLITCADVGTSGKWRCKFSPISKFCPLTCSTCT